VPKSKISGPKVSNASSKWMRRRFFTNREKKRPIIHTLVKLPTAVTHS